jgi:hypothetical protein
MKENRIIDKNVIGDHVGETNKDDKKCEESCMAVFFIAFIILLSS